MMFKAELMRIFWLQIHLCHNLFLLFSFFFNLQIFICGFAVATGGASRLLSGYDSYGNTCGRNNSKIEGVPLSGRDMSQNKSVWFIRNYIWVNHLFIHPRSEMFHCLLWKTIEEPQIFGFLCDLLIVGNFVGLEIVICIPSEGSVLTGTMGHAWWMGWLPAEAFQQQRQLCLIRGKISDLQTKRP